MSDPGAEIQRLQDRWPDAEKLQEGERTYVYLPTFEVSAPEGLKVISALLLPGPSADGYTTRLYFSERFSPKGANWNVFTILGRTWHACSWNYVPADRDWMDIIASHLRPLQ